MTTILAHGCCSAISPCGHQQRDPSSICATCEKAMQIDRHRLVTIQEQLREATNVIDALEKIAAIFLGEDARFQVAIGGNPYAIEAMLAESRDSLSRARAKG